MLTAIGAWGHHSLDQASRKILPAPVLEAHGSSNPHLAKTAEFANNITLATAGAPQFERELGEYIRSRPTQRASILHAVDRYQAALAASSEKDISQSRPFLGFGLVTLGARRLARFIGVPTAATRNAEAPQLEHRVLTGHAAVDYGYEIALSTVLLYGLRTFALGTLNAKRQAIISASLRRAV